MRVYVRPCVCYLRPAAARLSPIVLSLQRILVKVQGFFFFFSFFWFPSLSSVSFKQLKNAFSQQLHAAITRSQSAPDLTQTPDRNNTSGGGKPGHTKQQQQQRQREKARWQNCCCCCFFGFLHSAASIYSWLRPGLEEFYDYYRSKAAELNKRKKNGYGRVRRWREGRQTRGEEEEKRKEEASSGTFSIRYNICRRFSQWTRDLIQRLIIYTRTSKGKKKKKREKKKPLFVS